MYLLFLDVIDVLSKNLKFLENVTIEDLNTTLTLEVVEADLREYLLYHPGHIEKYPVSSVTIQKLYEERKAIRKKQLEAGASVSKTISWASHGYNWYYYEISWIYFLYLYFKGPS